MTRLVQPNSGLLYLLLGATLGQGMEGKGEGDGQLQHGWCFLHVSLFKAALLLPPRYLSGGFGCSHFLLLLLSFHGHTTRPMTKGVNCKGDCVPGSLDPPKTCLYPVMRTFCFLKHQEANRRPAVPWNIKCLWDRQLPLKR